MWGFESLQAHHFLLRSNQDAIGLYEEELRDYVTLMAILHSDYIAESSHAKKLLENRDTIEKTNSPALLSSLIDHLVYEYSDIASSKTDLQYKNEKIQNKVDDVKVKLKCLMEEYRAIKQYDVSDKIRSILMTLD